MALARLSFAKLLELVVTIVCLILHYKAEDLDGGVNKLSWGVFVAYTIILAGLFIGFLLSSPLNKRIDLVLSGLGCILFLITGALIIKTWNDQDLIHKFFNYDTDNRKYALTKGGLAIVNGVLFLFDLILTYRD